MASRKLKAVGSNGIVVEALFRMLVVRAHGRVYLRNYRLGCRKRVIRDFLRCAVATVLDGDIRTRIFLIECDHAHAIGQSGRSHTSIAEPDLIIDKSAHGLRIR